MRGGKQPNPRFERTSYSWLHSTEVYFTFRAANYRMPLNLNVRLLKSKMPRFVAFLRGVMPTNAKMPALKAAFEAAGFGHVKTILGSGNLAFDTPIQAEAEIEQKAEEAMKKLLGRSFYTIVRPSSHLQAVVAADPYANSGIPVEAKRVISFMRLSQRPKVALPLAEHQASVFMVSGREVFTAYVPTERGPVFMALIERAFGPNVTTRTFETVRKCALA